MFARSLFHFSVIAYLAFAAVQFAEACWKKSGKMEHFRFLLS